MAEIHDLNPTDASNTARFPEAQAPSTVNNGARALEGLIARYFFDNDTSVVATLSASLITITANRNSLTLTGTTSNYVANFMQAFTMGANPNTGPVRVTIDAVGPISIRDNRGVSLSSSILLAGARVLIVKDGTNDYFRLIWPHFAAGEYTDPLTTRGDLLTRDATVTTRLALGSSNQYLASTGSDPQWRSMAVQADQETGTGTTQPVVPAVQQFHPSAAKGWVEYNQVTPVIRASYNVTSITDNSAGNFTINWATDFSGVSYGYSISGQHDGTEKFYRAWVVNGGQAAGTLNVFTETPGAAAYDYTNVSVLAFGDQ